MTSLERHVEASASAPADMVALRDIGREGTSAPGAVAAPPARDLVAILLERNRQLEYALQSRIVIEQAKGVLAERLDLTVDAGFELLRQSARANRLRLHDLAARVVASRDTPSEIVAQLARR